jgi:hypothetical protein
MFHRAYSWQWAKSEYRSEPFQIIEIKKFQRLQHASSQSELEPRRYLAAGLNRMDSRIIKDALATHTIIRFP